MATIEERYGCIDCNLASCEGCDAFLLVKGATEQKAIDIENHWNWIRTLAKITMDVDISAYEDMFKKKALED